MPTRKRTSERNITRSSSTSYRNKSTQLLQHISADSRHRIQLPSDSQRYRFPVSKETLSTSHSATQHCLTLSTAEQFYRYRRWQNSCSPVPYTKLYQEHCTAQNAWYKLHSASWLEPIATSEKQTSNCWINDLLANQEILPPSINVRSRSHNTVTPDTRTYCLLPCTDNS